MSFYQKNLKTILSSRVDPQLKEDIQVEAYDAGMTVSNYLEQILEKRKFISNDEEEISAFESLELTQNELDNITAERDNLLERMAMENLLDEENNDLKNKMESNQVRNNQLTQKIASLKKAGIFFREFEREDFRRMMHELKQSYPNVPVNELILISLSEKIEQDYEIPEEEYDENAHSKVGSYWKKIGLFASLLFGGLFIRFIILRNKKVEKQKLINSTPSQGANQNNSPLMRYPYSPHF